jgi:hypothetical protein
MFKLSEYIDVKVTFDRLEALPVELSVARQEIWLAEKDRGQAYAWLEAKQRQALQDVTEGYAECKNAEQREQFKWSLFHTDKTVSDAQAELDKAEQNLGLAKNALANIQDRFSAIRNTVRLAQTVGALQYADAIDLAARLRQEVEEMRDDEIPF